SACLEAFFFMIQTLNSPLNLCHHESDELRRCEPSAFSRQQKSAASAALTFKLVKYLSCRSFAECLHCLLLAVVYVIHSDQFRDLQQITDPLSQVSQLDRSPGLVGSRIQRDQGSQATRVDVIHSAQVEDNVFILSEKLLYRVTKGRGFFAK